MRPSASILRNSGVPGNGVSMLNVAFWTPAFSDLINCVVTTIVFSPISRQYAPFGFHPPKQRRPWKWRQYVECCILDSRLFQELNGVLKYLRRVVIKPKNNPRLHGNPMRMDASNNP